MRHKFLKITILVLVSLLAVTCATDRMLSSATYDKESQQMQRIESSAQYTNGKFNNAVPWNQRPALSTMWDFFFSRNERTPQDSLPHEAVDLSFLEQNSDNFLSSTWIGHSSLLLNVDGRRLATDPVFEKRVSIFGPSRYNGKLPLDPDSIDALDVVLISHNHYDHLNKESIQLLRSRAAHFVVPLGVGAQLRKWGVDDAKIHEMDWWEEIELNGLRIAFTPTQHFSGRGLTDRDKTLWGSYVVIGPNHKIYFSGDSGYFDGFKTIGNKYGPFDMTFMECGAYDPAWKHIHMLPEETARAHLDLKGHILHPIHWGTFNLALHAWYDPMQRLSAAADSLGIAVSTPVVGGTTVYPQQIAVNRWWEQATEGQTRLATQP